ncbi:ferric reductase like transmembrane component-domain-containing protein [Favolaschia claudopus]|uniref:Ferric reductase like transmembrane component-domain-containing protein n=1 Tax=Favolaschia claudopus TaxID=2862362 RepID=A0AAV9Z7Q9_9AGAR
MNLFLSLLACISVVTAAGPVPISKSGLAGINGFYFYDPAGGHITGDEAAHNLALCRASSFPYLSSIAWCIHLYCPDDTRASKIETFWETEITGDAKVLPIWSFGEVMANITVPPNVVAMGQDLVLNSTMLTTEENWQTTWITLYYFFRETALESYYGLSICLTSFGLPLVLTWLGYLPFMTRGISRIRPYLYPSLIGTFHDRSLPSLLGNVPTVGQSGSIFVLVALNVIFLSIGYKTLYPDQQMQWYTSRYQELMAYLMWRTGVLAFCNMPVLFLFSSRNNVLLWLTNWSHPTYILMHRWIARLFLLHVLLHSILALVLYQNTGAYTTSLTLNWWIWGCVATVAAVILVLASALILRQRAYELFLVTHVVMAVICVVGCWYHVWYGYENTFGYETWLYATVGVWFFDRVVRVGRMVKMGVRRARVTELRGGGGIVRVDVPGVRYAAAPGHSVYVYFPTLNPLRPWENHPFSMVPTVMLTRADAGRLEAAEGAGEGDVEKGSGSGDHDVGGLASKATSGLTLFVRKSAGMTAALKAQERLLTLLEGPYPTNPTKDVLRTDRLVLIGGGIGITGLLPLMSPHVHTNIRLLLSLKKADECLLDELGAVLDGVCEKEVVVGQRLGDFGEVLREEAERGWERVGVVVCGPPGMCDDVRAAVGRVGREVGGGRCAFVLEVDSFAW